MEGYAVSRPTFASKTADGCIMVSRTNIDKHVCKADKRFMLLTTAYDQ